MCGIVHAILRFAGSLMTGAGLLLLSLMPGAAAMLTLENGRDRLSFDTAALLARADVADVEIVADIAYHGPRRYRAVPLSRLLAALPAPSHSAALEAAAIDGFAAQIPLSLAAGTAPVGAQAWLAIEPADTPWPRLPGKASSAGPFYIVWQGPKTPQVPSEDWAYQLAALRYVPAPAARWPQLAVAGSLPADHPAGVGQEVFAAFCLACHRMNGGGSSEMGPDLNLPMNPTEYFQPAALRQYLRNPASVRVWPGQKMPAFGPEKLSEAELDAVITYLEHMAELKRLPR